MYFVIKLARGIQTYKNAGNIKNPQSLKTAWGLVFLERITRFELATHSLGSYCSTTELYPQYVLPVYYITNHLKGQGESTQAAQKIFFKNTKNTVYKIQKGAIIGVEKKAPGCE